MHHLDNADRLADSYELARSACAVDQLSPGVQRGCEPYEPQLAAIRAAKHSVYLEAYIFYSGHSADAFLAALRERAKAGVAVRVTSTLLAASEHRNAASLRSLRRAGRFTDITLSTGTCCGDGTDARIVICYC